MSDQGHGSQSKLPLSRAEAAGSGFATTHWSVVLMAGQEDLPAAALALENLCRTYWYPLYAYARRQGHSPEDGQDLTQQFLAGFLQKKYFSVANPDRGRFRNFLIASFKHFLANEYHRIRTAKRGGAYAFVSWDEAQAEGNYRNESACTASPDKLFEQAWALTLLGKVMKDLQQEYANAGKARLFEALQIFLSGEKSEVTYAQIATGLGVSAAAVKMAVSRLRQRYGQLLRREIAQTTEPAQVEDELRHLFEALNP